MDDAHLVQRVLQGDGDAFALLFHRYNSFICKVIYHIVRKQQDMEDIAGSTWKTAWETLSTLRDRSSFKFWLTTIAKNAARDHLRRNRRREEGGNEEDEGPIDPEDVEEVVATAIAFEEAMEVALEQMRPEQRKCFHYHFQGCTNNDIAEWLDLAEGTVRTYISGAKKILYEEFCRRLNGDQNHE